MENLTALNLFNLLPDTLESLDTFQVEIENELYENGNLEGHEILSKLRLCEKLIKYFTSNPRFMQQVYSEIYDKETDFGNYVIKETARTQYEFEKTEKYTSLLSAVEKAKQALKDYEKWAKAIPDEGVVDEETGEIFEPPVKVASKTILAVTFKKPNKKEHKDNHFDKIFN